MNMIPNNVILANCWTIFVEYDIKVVIVLVILSMC
jgi:hypothetical protein